MPQELGLSVDAPLAIPALLINLGIGVVLSLVLRWHFERFGSTLSNREEYAQVFPFLTLTTVLIISVVKSSLALSLGLVGALSIVRFRTPIKEPEELAYIFIAIAIGLGLGANQTAPTVVAALVILFVIAALRWTRREARSKNLFLSIDWQSEGDEDAEGSLRRINEVISHHVGSMDLRRLDVRQGSVEATYCLDIAGTDNLSALMDEARRSFPTINFTFLDQNQLPSI